MPNLTEEDKSTKPLLADVDMTALSQVYAIENTDLAVAEQPHFLGHGTIPKPIYILSGNGAELTTNKGKVIDFSAMVVNCVLGQNDPWVNANLCAYIQSGRPSYTSITLGGHELYYTFPQRLAQLKIGGIPDPVFNFRQCNGTDAIELAVIAAWANRKKEENRSVLVSFKGSFHGQNLTSFMASDILNANVFLVDKPKNVVFLEQPPHAENMEEEKLTPQEAVVLEQLKEKAQEAFAVLIEPIQMNNGGHTFSKAFLQGLSRICKENNICFIIDEIQTGMGWLGTLTLSEKLDLQPDIITLGKGLTGGNGALSLMVARKKYDYVPNCATGKTNGADIRALVAAHAILDRLLGLPANKVDFVKGKLQQELQTGLLPRAANISQLLNANLKGLKELFPDNIGAIRGNGTIRFIQIINAKTKQPDADLTGKIHSTARENGVFIRSNGSWLLVKTPLTITDAELKLGFENLIKTINICLGKKFQPVENPSTARDTTQMNLMRGLSFLVASWGTLFQLDETAASPRVEVRAALNRL